MRGTLVIPTLNEVASVGHVIRTFTEAAVQANAGPLARDPITWDVLVVDGASTDGTAAAAEAAGAQVIVEPRRGYGRAYRTGFALARGEIVATADADATYPVERIPELAAKLRTEKIDFITTDRMAYLDRRAMTTEHRIGNGFLNFTLRLAYQRFLTATPGATLRDSQSGMWVFRRDILQRIRLTQDGMTLSEELKIEVVLRGFRWTEVPIRYAERWGAPKLSSWRDGIHNFLFLLEKRLEVARELRESPTVVFGNGREEAQ